jgi:hypothetical protein
VRWLDTAFFFLSLVHCPVRKQKSGIEPPHSELLAENKLQDNFTASPGVSGGRLYLRGFNHLYAIADKGK